MPIDSSLPDVNPGDGITAAGQNKVIDDLNDLRRDYADNFQLGKAQSGQRPAIVHFHVTQDPASVNTTNNSGGTYAICRLWDGTKEQGGDTPIYLQQDHAINDDVFAFIPAYGTGQTYQDPTTSSGTQTPIIWMEMGGGGGNVPVPEFYGDVLFCNGPRTWTADSFAYTPIIPNS